MQIEPSPPVPLRVVARALAAVFVLTLLLAGTACDEVRHGAVTAADRSRSHPTTRHRSERHRKPPRGGLPRGLIGRIPTTLPTRRRVVALTFDAGADDAGLPKIAATLHRFGVPATFFVTGHFARYYPGWTRTLAERYSVANHTMNHVDLNGLSDAQVRAEISDARRSIRAVSGRNPQPFFRFPYGVSSRRTLAIVNALGYAAVGWTADTAGWLGTSGGQSLSSVVGRAVDALRPGAILLMHAGSNPNDGTTLDADALATIIARIERRGYGFTTLSQAYAAAYPTWRRVSTDGAVGSRPASGLARLIGLGRPVYCGSARRPDVALTFDDGPGPNTRATIRLLRRFGDRATFFLVGRNLAGWPGLARAELGVGVIGDHTWTHPFLTRLRARAAEAEIERTQAALVRETGVAVRLFRPPYGFHDLLVDRITRRLGMLEVLWSLDSRDSYPPPGAGPVQIERTLRRLARPGSIVLLHENLPATAKALPTVLQDLRARGLRSVSVPQLLALDPPTRSQLAEGAGGCA
jgi:peptidoglycan/xylan/chitin deacetylase (PgdA/CDA1 family)